VIGSDLIVVNTGLLLFSLASCAIAPVLNIAATSAKVMNLFICNSLL
jgi:hypothetical protein